MIDRINAEQLEPGDLIREGIVTKIAESEDSIEHILVFIEDEDEPLILKWDAVVDILGN